jgi:hypothetical protein
LKIKRDVEDELVYLINDPAITSLADIHGRQVTDRGPMPDSWIRALTRYVILFEPDDTEHGSGEVLWVHPQCDQVPWSVGISKYLYSAPSPLGWYPADDEHDQVKDPKTGAVIVISRSIRIFPVSAIIPYKRSDSWVQSHPKEALLEILKKGHVLNSEGIGPPYVIVHVIRHKGKKSEVHWVQKGTCPGWTEDLGPDEPVKALRLP